MKPLSLKIINQLGLIGSTGVPTGSLVPRAETPQAIQHQFQDFTDAGRVADPDVWSRYNTMLKRPVSFDSMLALWMEMADWDLMTAALSEIVQEAIQTDAMSPGSIWFECNDRKFEDDLNDMMTACHSEDILPSQIWYVAAIGNSFEKIEYEPDKGVLGLSFANPLDVRRYWLERNRRCVGFRWAGRPPRRDDPFVQPDNKTPIQRVALNTGQNVDNLWYPWDFLHFRRTGRLRQTEHGEPIFEEAQGIYKKLRLAIDQMVVHRAQVQPDRFVVNVDVKDQPPAEQMKTVNRWKQSLRSKLSFGPGSGVDGLNDPTGFNAFYNSLALDTILWMAKPTGFQHTVEKLAGTANVPDVYDIELLTDLFYSIIGMPKSWFGVTKDQGEAPSGKALVAQDMRFLRKIKTIRRPIINGYTWLGYFHAALKNQSLPELEIRAKMSPLGSLEDQMKIELLQSQSEVLLNMGEVMDKYKLPREAWVEVIFKRYLHMPDDVVNVFMTALPVEASAQTEGRKEAPNSFKLIKEISDSLASNPEGLRKISQLKELLYGEEKTLRIRERRDTPRFKSTKELLEPPSFQDYDLIVSSFGKDPFQFRSPTKLPSGKTYSTGEGERLNDSQNPAEPKIKGPLTLNQVTEETLKSQSGSPSSPTEPAYRKFMG